MPDIAGPQAPAQLLRAERVLTPEGIRPAALEIRDGQIAAIHPLDAPAPADATEQRLEGGVLMPGLVDTHVHLNEPGRTAWEGFESGTRAAAAGGITTVVDMPLNCIPATTSVAALAEKRAVAEGRCATDVAFWGGVVPGNTHELRGLHEAGVVGFKCFLVESGVDEFPCVDASALREGARELAALDALLIVHAEVPGPIEAAEAQLQGSDPRAYSSWLDSRPPAAEIEAIRLVIDVAEETGLRAHIVHLSAAGALPEIVQARARGVRITAETCPHYLCFAAEEIPAGDTAFKCAPPIREAANRDALWAGLAAGEIDFVVSDHSPCTLDLKRQEEGDFIAAWGGVASLQIALSAVWTEAQARGHDLVALSRWMSHNPARLVGLLGRKGIIAPGADADLCLFDPDASTEVRATALLHRNPVTPYERRQLRGRVRGTWLRGQAIWDGEEILIDHDPKPGARARILTR